MTTSNNTKHISTNKNDEMSPTNPTNPTYQQNNGMSQKDKNTVMLRTQLREELKKDLKNNKVKEGIETGLSVFGLGCLAVAAYSCIYNSQNTNDTGAAIGAIGLASGAITMAMQTGNQKRKNKLIRDTISSSKYATPEMKETAHREAVNAHNTPALNILNGVEYIAGAAGTVNAIYAASSIGVSGLANTLSSVDFTTLGVAGAIIAASEIFVKQPKEIKSARIVEQSLGNAMPQNIHAKQKVTRTRD